MTLVHARALLSSYPRQKCTYRTQLAWQCFLLVMLAPVLQKLHSTIQQINNNWGLVYEDRTLVAWMIFPKVTVTSLPLGFMPWLLSCLQCTVLKLVDSASPPLLSHSNFYFSLPQLLSFQLQQAIEQSDVPLTSIFSQQYWHISREFVMGINEMITEGKLLWTLMKFSQLFLKGKVWTSV